MLSAPHGQRIAPLGGRSITRVPSRRWRCGSGMMRHARAISGGCAGLAGSSARMRRWRSPSASTAAAYGTGPAVPPPCRASRGGCPGALPRHHRKASKSSRFRGVRSVKGISILRIPPQPSLTFRTAHNSLRQQIGSFGGHSFGHNACSIFGLTAIHLGGDALHHMRACSTAEVRGSGVYNSFHETHYFTESRSDDGSRRQRMHPRRDWSEGPTKG